MRQVLLAAVLAAGAALTLSAQQRPAATFRVDVNYVEIDAVVTDAQGRFVANLKKEDFELVEEGAPQTITTFTLVHLPVTKPDPPLFRGTPVEPDVRTNMGNFDGRVMLLVLDDLQIDAKRSMVVRAAARQFVRRNVGANDLVAVVTTGGRSTAMQDFTSSHLRLGMAIDKFLGRKPPRPAADANIAGDNQAARIAPEEKVANARNVLRMLKASAEYLANIRGRRKAVVWFSEGVDVDIEDPMTEGRQIRDEMRAAVASASRGGVSIYGVDARGLSAGLDEGVELGLKALDHDNMERPSAMSRVLDELRHAQSFLQTISAATGGFAVMNQNNFNDAFARIIQDNSHYYLLGYYPTNNKRDGKFRKLQVRVTRPGHHVKFKEGYTAPSGKAVSAERPRTSASAPADLRAALDSPLPIDGLGMRVFAAPFSGPSNKGSVAIIVEVEPSRFKFQSAGASFSEDIEIIILPVNGVGKALEGSRDQLPLRLSGKAFEAVSKFGLRFSRRIDLPPGRYQLHVAAKASNGNAVGALTYDIDVPDFTSAPLTMSGIALMSLSAGKMAMAPPDKAFHDVLPVPATASRSFAASDTLSLFTEVYSRQLGTAHAVEIKTTVTGDDGRVAFTSSDTRRSEEIKGKSGGFGHTVEIPLRGFTSGRYVLRIEGNSSLGGDPVARELEFRVR